MRILIIEDDEALARAMTTVLKREDHHVHVVDSVAECRTTFRAFEPDVLILDMNLRDSKGLGTMRVIQELNADIPIIVYSGSEVWAREAMRLGAKEYLIKGEFTPMDLPRAIEFAVNRHKIVKALERDEKSRRGEFSWPGKRLTDVSKAADNMLSLAMDLKAVAEG